MALFAAYEDLPPEQEKTTKKDETWLKNPSFQTEIDIFQKTETYKLHPGHYDLAEEGNVSNASASTRKSKRKVRPKKSENKNSCEHNDFEIDTNRNLGYCKISTISDHSAPKYTIAAYVNNNRISTRKPKKYKRYYQVIIDEKTIDEIENETLTSADLEKKIKKNVDSDFSGFEQEEELTKMTSHYNKILADEPNNIDIWIKYINFQDTVFEFEKTYRKGSIAKGLRVMAEKKLSILDKALIHNPDNEKLLRLRLNVAVGVYPADELQVLLGKLVGKEQTNIIFWQGFIEATQCSMSHCTTSSVLALYIKCLHTLHTIRRSAKLEKSLLEENILRMLYQCGLFLKQTGLFEQLWTLLRLYLELNLSPTNDHKFSINVDVDEDQLFGLEEVVLSSQLPLHELWLRVEKLREACHWMPINRECEDPQRVVFTEDVSDLIHPITMPGNTFKLTVTILTLLKVPLLPCRHTTMKKFGIDYVPWALDSIETLLPIFLPLNSININNEFVLKYTQKLTVGPQYLRTLPGQEEYLQFILSTMHLCIESLNGNEKLAVTVWWIRFLRLLIILEKTALFKITSSLKKKLKSDIKNILKASPGNLILFQEYAFYENDSGNIENACNILKNSLRTCNNKPVMSISDEDERAVICSTFRALIEVLLSDPNNKDLILKYYTIFILGKNYDEVSRFLIQTHLNETKKKLSEMTSLLLDDYANHYSIEGFHHFLPDFITNWIILNGWFLYLTSSVNDCRILIENVINKLDEYDIDKSWHKEIFYEFLVAVFFKESCEKSGSGLFRSLDDTLHTAIQLYPNNLFLLSVLAKLQSMYFSLGKPWWKIKNLLLNAGHALPSLFLVLIANQRICDIEDNYVDTISGDTISTISNFRNTMLSLFKSLTKADMCTRRCGLVWRLYLQFLHAYFDAPMVRNVYYSAVDECPWLKSLYIDAAIYIPNELTQIQDLIIEKQLRIHVTPEELEILRN